MSQWVTALAAKPEFHPQDQRGRREPALTSSSLDSTGTPHGAHVQMLNE